MDQDSAVYSASTIRRLTAGDGGFEWGRDGLSVLLLSATRPSSMTG